MKHWPSTLEPQPTSTSTLVRWEFARGAERLTCQVDRETDSGDFALAIVPHRRLQWTSIEKFRAVAAALRRHASVVSQLRASGWKLVAYTK
jgi:hypothetical protein